MIDVISLRLDSSIYLAIEGSEQARLFLGAKSNLKLFIL